MDISSFTVCAGNYLRSGISVPFPNKIGSLFEVLHETDLIINNRYALMLSAASNLLRAKAEDGEAE